MSKFWYGFIAGLTTATMLFVLLSPDDAHASTTTYPGQRALDPAAIAPLVAVAEQAAREAYPDAQPLNGCDTVTWYAATDLGVTGLGSPAGGRGGGCEAWMLDGWAIMIDQPTQQWYPQDLIMLCNLIAHEELHAKYGVGHSKDPNNLMFDGNVLPDQPACVKAYTPTYTDEVVNKPSDLRMISWQQAKSTVKHRLHGKGWTIRLYVSESTTVVGNKEVILSYGAVAKRRVCRKSKCKTQRREYLISRRDTRIKINRIRL